MSSIKVLTFNMQFGQTWNDEDPDNAVIDIEPTIRHLRELDADIISPQEVERVEPERGQVDPPPNYSRLIDAMRDYDSFFAYPPADPRELPFGYGLAIFSKTDLFDVTVTPLPAPELEFKFNGARTLPTRRVLIGARTRINGRTLQLFNTHLQAFFIINENSDEHKCQRDVVARALGESSLPTIIGGDFNAAPGEGTVDQFESLGYSSVQRSEITWRRMPYVLDHLLYNTQLKNSGHSVIETDASDHKILMADFEFATTRKPAGDTQAPFATASKPQG